MKVAAGILCWNHIKTGRADLFTGCYESLVDASPDVLVVADNGSTDGTTYPVDHVTFPTLAGFPHGNTCGYGMNKLAATLLMEEPDIIVLSNDDIVWAPDSMVRVRRLWAEAPEELAIISGLVEPLFAIPDEEPWNLVYGREDIAGEDVWTRKSVPGGAWSFRAKDFPVIFPVSTFPGVDDVPACEKVRNQGRTVGCVDLATHAGIDRSSWGNASHQRFMVQTVDEWKAAVE
jgi:glycosyltransferase involved in cell wall biosynthesis